MTIRKKAALIIALCAMICQGTAGAASDTKGHWAENILDEYTKANYLNVYADDSVHPDQAITRGEFVLLMNHLFGYTEADTEGFADVNQSHPLYQEILVAKKAGYINGYAEDNTFRADKSITRAEISAVLSKALQLAEADKNTLEGFKDSQEIPAWAQNYMNTVVAKGYFTGYTDATLRSKKEITRAEAVTLMSRVAGQVVAKGNLENKEISGNLTVTGKDLSLKNVTVKGDLILAAGIGESNVTLDKVKVEGLTLIQGGGEHSAIVKDSMLKEVLVNKLNGKVRILAKGDTTIVSTQIKSGAKLEAEGLTGNGFGRVEVTQINEGQKLVLDVPVAMLEIQQKSAVELAAKASVTQMKVADQAQGAKIDLAEGAQIKALVAEGKAEVTGKGKIETAVIKAQGFKMAQNPVNLVVNKGIQANVAGKAVDSSNNKLVTISEKDLAPLGKPELPQKPSQPSTSTPPSGGGGGGGSSTGGGGSTTPPTPQPPTAEQQSRTAFLEALKTDVPGLNTSLAGKAVVSVSGTTVDFQLLTNNKADMVNVAGQIFAAIQKRGKIEIKTAAYGYLEMTTENQFKIADEIYGKSSFQARVTPSGKVAFEQSFTMRLSGNEDVAGSKEAFEKAVTDNLLKVNEAIKDQAEIDVKGQDITVTFKTKDRGAVKSAAEKVFNAMSLQGEAWVEIGGQKIKMIPSNIKAIKDLIGESNTQLTLTTVITPKGQATFTSTFNIEFILPQA